MNVYRFVLAFPIFVVPLGLFAGTKELMLTNGDHFRVVFPDSFNYEQVSLADSGLPVAFTLKYAQTTNGTQLSFQVLINKVSEKSELDSQEAVDRFIVKAVARALRNAVEKEVTPVHYSPDGGFGSYAVVTDPALVSVENPKPGDYRHLIMGALRRGKYVIFLRGYTNSVESDYFSSANQILQTLQADASGKVP